MKKDTTKKELTDNEEKFCGLYVYGGADYAGQLIKCYETIFGTNRQNSSILAHKLIVRPHIILRLKELSDTLQNETEHMATKLQITETLKAIMEEASTANFDDKFGVTLSPAPLRAVAVNAAKALMDLYPIKHIHETRFRIEGDKGGVVFNVVVPEIKNNEEDNT